jgi:hypothetical protein
MAFTQNILLPGTSGDAADLNVNFLEIYDELEEFPASNGSIKADSITGLALASEAVEFSKIASAAICTDLSTATAQQFATSAAITSYWEGLFT